MKRYRDGSVRTNAAAAANASRRLDPSSTPPSFPLGDMPDNVIMSVADRLDAESRAFLRESFRRARDAVEPPSIPGGLASRTLFGQRFPRNAFGPVVSRAVDCNPQAARKHFAFTAVANRFTADLRSAYLSSVVGLLDDDKENNNTAGNDDDRAHAHENVENQARRSGSVSGSCNAGNGDCSRMMIRAEAGDGTRAEAGAVAAEYDHPRQPLRTLEAGEENRRRGTHHHDALLSATFMSTADLAARGLSYLWSAAEIHGFKRDPVFVLSWRLRVAAAASDELRDASRDEYPATDIAIKSGAMRIRDAVVLASSGRTSRALKYLQNRYGVLRAVAWVDDDDDDNEHDDDEDDEDEDEDRALQDLWIESLSSAIVGGAKRSVAWLLKLAMLGRDDMSAMDALESARTSAAVAFAMNAFVRPLIHHALLRAMNVPESSFAPECDDSFLEWLRKVTDAADLRREHCESILSTSSFVSFNRLKAQTLRESSPTGLLARRARRSLCAWAVRFRASLREAGASNGELSLGDVLFDPAVDDLGWLELYYSVDPTIRDDEEEPLPIPSSEIAALLAALALLKSSYHNARRVLDVTLARADTEHEEEGEALEMNLSDFSVVLKLSEELPDADLPAVRCWMARTIRVHE